LLALLAAAGLTVVLLAAGVVLAVVHAVDPATEDRADGVPTGGSVDNAIGSTPTGSAALEETHDSLAARSMPVIPESASHPGPVSDRDPGAPILRPAATDIGPAGVLTGFPRTPEGAMAQLAAIDQSALQSGSMDA
jgi:hypothetical protein